MASRWLRRHPNQPSPYGPGGYRFMDFVRMGVPLDILVMMVTLIVVPATFPLR